MCMPKPEKQQLFAQKQALGGSLFYLWFSLLFMFYPGFRSSRQPGNKEVTKLETAYLVTRFMEHHFVPYSLQIAAIL